MEVSIHFFDTKIQEIKGTFSYQKIIQRTFLNTVKEGGRLIPLFLPGGRVWFEP
jgi:hypothetical protein